jgi:serine phosphatase RsbU (regulator of sigma subunit)/pSer/pThr/pTyr-binding forkhead associated (FHA) protein
VSAEPTVAELRLQPVEGPRAEPVVVSGDTSVIFGRATESDVCLPDPSVSREHASIARRGEQWLITDRDSRNGTHLNGIRLQAETAALAAPGDFVRMGRYTFRMEFGEETPRSYTTTDGAEPQGTIVERVTNRELESLAHRRLELLIDGAAAIQTAETEEALAKAIVEVALSGTGYRRAAVLRHAGSTEQVEVVVSRDLADEEGESFTFSRSLLNVASEGHIARLSETHNQPLGQSIERLGIHCALCAPIMLDTSVIGSIYLDARGAEQSAYRDAVGFCHAVARLAGLALANLKRAELEARQKRLDSDLNAAREAQAFLLPPEESTIGGLTYAMKSFPGRIVAGDLFDVFAIDEHRVGICCGDVSGQGMGAAILMTTVLSHIRAALVRYGEPAEATNEVNHSASERSPANMFVSLWVGIYDARDHVLRYVDGGHGHWIVRRAGSPPESGPSPNGLILGIDPDYAYVARELALEPGDRFVLYSDGVVEHRDPSGDLFGPERLLEALEPAATPVDDIAMAMDALRTFIGGAMLEDDTTIASLAVTE